MTKKYPTIPIFVRPVLTNIHFHVASEDYSGHDCTVWLDNTHSQLPGDWEANDIYVNLDVLLDFSRFRQHVLQATEGFVWLTETPQSQWEKMVEEIAKEERQMLQTLIEQDMRREKEAAAREMMQADADNVMRLH